MKFYYPTTTLNFDSILSSQMISPPGFYKPGTLWWNRHEAIIGESRSDILTLYSKCPTWEIDDPNRDNYPLVIEIDKSFKKLDKVECEIGGSLKAICIFTSLTFTMSELLQGKVKFLFRNNAEKERMLIRVRTSVSECKVVNALMIDCPEAFDFIPTGKAKTFKLEEVLSSIDNTLRDHPIRTPLEYTSLEIHSEREHGAALGYQVGRNVKYLRSGLYLSAYREPIFYSEWKKDILPEPFAALIDKLCDRSLLDWDPNRVAVAKFCEECWYDCFMGRKIKGKVVNEKSELYASIKAIAHHWVDPEFYYRISAETNQYLQAFAAFLECGDMANKYPRFAKEKVLKSPEYLLALYGALVGYTSFSRILLESKMYLPIDKIVLPQNRANNPSVTLEGKSKDYAEKEAQKPDARPLSPTPKIEQPTFSNLDSARHVLLIHDAELLESLGKEFVDLAPDKMRELQKVIGLFTYEYREQGYYGQRPERYHQSNPDLIDHLVCCLSSQGTPKLNVDLDEDDQLKFVRFLEKRYQCKRNTHH